MLGSPCMAAYLYLWSGNAGLELKEHKDKHLLWLADAAIRWECITICQWQYCYTQLILWPQRLLIGCLTVSTSLFSAQWVGMLLLATLPSFVCSTGQCMLLFAFCTIHQHDLECFSVACDVFSCTITSRKTCCVQVLVWGEADIVVMIVVQWRWSKSADWSSVLGTYCSCWINALGIVGAWTCIYNLDLLY